MVLQTLLLLEVLGGKKIGAKYVKSFIIIKPIFEIMKGETQDTPMRETSLRVLQILSLDRQIMIQMIELDVIKWVVNLLKNEGNVLSDNNLEYATALLMNLTLRSLGKKKCEELTNDILKVLNENLEHENNQVRTYVNGTLYSVLESKKLREEAKATNLDQALEYLLKNSEQNF